MATISKQEELLQELLKEYADPADALKRGGLVDELKKRLIEKAMRAELDNHLGYAKHEKKGTNSGNSRNATSKKTVLSDSGKIELKVPRDRTGDFNPQILPKGQRRFEGFDDKIIAMYARGLSVRDIQSMLEEMYQVEVSQGLISNVTDAISQDVKLWQNRPLDEVYAIVYLDALAVNIRQESRVIKKSVYLALGVDLTGHKQLLGIWIAPNEGAKFWLGVLTELQNRGVKDILIACVDGLSGFPQAIKAAYPQTQVQLCIVHMVRTSCRYVSSKDRKQVCRDLKHIYQAATVQEAELALSDFSNKWNDRYPSIHAMWKRHWENIITFFQYSSDIRKAIYTTNAIESLNRSMRKIIKTKGLFPSDESVVKLFYLALANISKKWTRPIQNWSQALNQFEIHFKGRFSI